MPPARTSSSWRPCSAMPSGVTTTMRSAFRIVARRWAMTSVVRPCASSASDCWIARSVSVSSAEVASSRIRIGGFFRNMRAMARRCFCPPESLTPRSPMIVSSPSGRSAIIVVQPRAPRRLHDLGLGRVEPAVGDVLADRAGEEEDVLLHDADLARAARPASSSRMSMPSIVIAPGVDLVEARQQRAERRLAGAGRADEGDRLARPRSSRLMSRSTGRSGRVAEGDVLEADVAAQRRRRRSRPARRRCPARCRAARV